MKHTLEALMDLQKMDKTALSAIRGDLERLFRAETDSLASGEYQDPEAGKRYLEALDKFLDFVCAMEGYDRTPIRTFDFSDLTEETPALPALVEAHTDEVPTTRWVTA